MPYQKYSIVNNATCLLDLAISDSSTILQVKGTYDRFPTSNFVIKIYEGTPTQWTKMENILIASRVGNVMNVGSRACEAVPSAYTDTTSVIQALAFSSDAVIELTASEKVLEDMQNEITRLEDDKLDTSVYVSEKQLFSSSST
jgi:hypothetical protein